MEYIDIQETTAIELLIKDIFKKNKSELGSDVRLVIEKHLETRCEVTVVPNGEGNNEYLLRGLLSRE